MRWVLRWIFAVNFCDEFRISKKIYLIHRISYKILPKNLDPGVHSREQSADNNV